MELQYIKLNKDIPLKK